MSSVKMYKEESNYLKLFLLYKNQKASGLLHDGSIDPILLIFELIRWSLN